MNSKFELNVTDVEVKYIDEKTLEFKNYDGEFKIIDKDGYDTDIDSFDNFEPTKSYSQYQEPIKNANKN